MSFVWPWALLLLALVPVFAVGYLVLERRRRTRLASLGTLGTVVGGDGRAMSGRRHAVRRWLPAALVLAGLAVLVVALARPQAVVGVPREEGIVVLAFDVSGSMAADDMEPTRMEAAKAAASSFVERQPEGVIVGVIAFSDSGLSVQVPTRDQDAVLAAIARLDPQRGTSLTQGVTAAIDAIVDAQRGVEGYYTSRSPAPEPEPEPVPVGPGSQGAAVVVMLTDGEATSDRDPLAGAKAAAAQGIRIHTVGLGSAAGAVLDIEGFRVHTRLNEPMVRAIADLTGGTYHHAQSAEELQAVYDTLDTRLVIEDETTEVTSLVAALGLLLLTLGGVVGLTWLGRLP